MQTIQGDLFQLAKGGEFDVIVHGCNCFCTMGAGFAKGVAREFPEAYKADLQTKRGDRAKLGTCSTATVQIAGGSLTIVNAYTQYDFRGRGDKVDYEAVRSCMRWIAATYPQMRIGMPRIGAGLAGGNWTLIEQIIQVELASVDATIVEFKQ